MTDTPLRCADGTELAGGKEAGGGDRADLAGNGGGVVVRRAKEPLPAAVAGEE